MTNGQKIILKFVQDNFIGMRCIPREGTEVLTIDKHGKRVVLTVNAFGDIMEKTSGGAKIIAISDVPHDLDELIRNPYVMPTSWQVAKN